MSDTFRRHVIIFFWSYGIGSAVLGVIGVVPRWQVPLGLLLFVLYSRIIFHDTRNLVQSIGPVYWFVGDISMAPHTIGRRVRMVERAAPWRRGFGYAIDITDRTMIQIGFCRRRPVRDVTEQLGVRTLDWDADTIDERLTNRWRMGKKAS